jgi:hypothetical protein
MTHLTQRFSKAAGSRSETGVLLHRRPTSTNSSFGTGHEQAPSSDSRGFAESRFAHDFSSFASVAVPTIQRQATDVFDEEPAPAAMSDEGTEGVSTRAEEAAGAGAAGGVVMEWHDIDVGGALGMGPDAGAGVAEAAPDAAAPGGSERPSGEGTESDGGTPQADAGPSDAGSPGACDPQPLSRANYLASTGTRKSDFGLTRLAGPVGVPVVQVSPARNGRLSPTGASMPPLTSVYTQGTFVEGTGLLIGQGSGPRECPGGSYPKEWTIRGTGESKIREAEQEHCADFRLAFDVSLSRFAQAVNAAAQSGRTFADQQAAERFFTRQLGVSPASWLLHFECLAAKTKIRDSSHAHEPVGVERGSLRPQPPCDRAMFRIFLRDSHFPRIPGSAPSSLITPAGCPI